MWYRYDVKYNNMFFPNIFPLPYVILAYEKSMCVGVFLYIGTQCCAHGYIINLLL